MAFELPDLPYDYNALEPTISAQIMQLHHDKHHATYTTKFNGAIEQAPELQGRSAEDIVRNLDSVPESVRNVVRNHGGGYVNHAWYWQMMSPDSGGEPTGDLMEAIGQKWGSFDAFKQEFETAGANQFGSGWVWLILDDTGSLAITTTANQDTPLSAGKHVVMGNDVWEHAYYLDYKSDRAAYLKAWWDVVNWRYAAERFGAK
jgi:superoxide dismutase, Fe-Mn family